ncbi:MAG TPA: hypothetical protein PKX92_07505 [Edaphocola sp.]|nr:hypothetical protein [Edaphocola sp.]
MSLFSMGCVGENHSLNEGYFVGTWQSEGNAKIVLNKNGKGELFNFNYENVNSIANKNSILNGTCEWKLEQINGSNKVVITYYDGGTIQYLNKMVQTNLKISFQIEGTGVFENKPPWNLFVFIGDPDELNKYTFTKEE